MTPSPTHRPLAHALIWTGVSLVLGCAILFIVIGAEWPAYEDAGADRAALSRELSVHIFFGIITLAILPVVLWLDGRTLPRKTLRPKVLAAEKLREFLTTSGRGGEDFLTHDGSVESLQRRTGGWVPVTLGLIGIFLGTISLLGVAAASILTIALAARQSWLLSFGALLVSMLSQAAGYVLTPNAIGQFELPLFLVNGTVFAALVVIGVIRGAREQGLIDTAAQTLLRERSRQDRAVAEVRQGIARDMHDSLSHHLSVIAMYSGALSVRRDLDPESVHESARLIASSARRSGIELREVLTMLRGDDQGTVIDPDIDRLVAEGPDTVTLDYAQPLVSESLHSLGTLERTTIYRFVQEAMTNAFKHAPGQSLAITISDGEEEAAGDWIALTARNRYPDNPLGSTVHEAHSRKQYIAGSGLGILGLKERMEAMGGDLDVTHYPDFELRARIPVQNVEETHA
ncbi:MAG: histidine kinase [Brevibacterium sp.]|nr:histidine kinase [Brevibacterium sp.]MDN6666887.1 histidine kinase [Brevibacterium sp.]